MTLNNIKTNGCGANSGVFKNFKPPYHLFFKASCNLHDEGYNKGGTERDRWYADNRFWLAMRLDIYKSVKNPFLRQYYFMWCRIYYIAVRLFGKKQFNYNGPLTSKK